MPNQTLYTVLLVLGFVLGIIWGALSYNPYKQMKLAIEAGDAVAANQCAKKIRKWFIVGMVINIVALIGSFS